MGIVSYQMGHSITWLDDPFHLFGVVGAPLRNWSIGFGAVVIVFGGGARSWCQSILLANSVEHDNLRPREAAFMPSWTLYSRTETTASNGSYNCGHLENARARLQLLIFCTEDNCTVPSMGVWICRHHLGHPPSPRTKWCSHQRGHSPCQRHDALSR